ncbi:hypothetical protein GCM10010441_27340 [Kitasatospora paracochleata]|uniref:SAM-dependent methyltransferase n=1 Tax=Kitasatospora paracochleata TaxID=58354 RepID=A0ABT1IWD0_9ACTN|nr:methyltransferase [Kitasatospora paracochleata]MCP2309453.1 SAM-dependent methyltransferase [Kitasatospora paracochleata]
MSYTHPLLRALRALGDRPALMTAEGRPVSGNALLRGKVPEGLAEAVAGRVAHLPAFPTRGSDPAERRLRHWAGILGPPPIRHTVAYPVSELAVDLALATVLAGGTVICGEPDQSPSHVLARLAGSRTTHLSLPSDLLWRLVRVSGLHANDLSRLRRVVHIGPEPRQEDVYAAVDALGAVVAHVREPHTGPEAADTTLHTVTAAAAAQAWKHGIGISAEQARTFTERLEAAVLASMLIALQHRGVLTDPARDHTLTDILDAARVTSEYRPLVERWLEVLADHGLITSDGRLHRARIPVEPAAIATLWKLAADAWTGHLGSATVIDFLRRCAERLPALLAGERRAADLLLPKGSMRIADAFGRQTATGRYFTTALTTTLRDIALAHSGPGPLRVLEIGAGTGHTTAAIATALAAEGNPGPAVDYLCTDASELLLAAARSRLARHARVRCALFDLHGEPGEHGPRPGSFDVIVATGALGDSPDPGTTARRLAALLVPGGWLLLTEPILEPYEALISRVFLHPVARFGSGSPAASRDRWLDALAGAGIGTVLTLPDENHPLTLLGRQLFTARVP